MNSFAKAVCRVVCTLILGVALAIVSLRASDSTKVVLGFSYTADMLRASHNANSHNAHLGLLNANIGINTQPLGLWTGGFFYAKAFAAYGGTPSSDFICDVQVVSNIEAGEYYGLYELYYQHSFGERLTITGGLLDLNSDFYVADNASLFINSAFGVGSNLSLNHTPAIYPVTGLGIMGGFEFSPSFTLKAGVYDGTPEIAERGLHGFNAKLKSGDGILSIGEAQYIFKQGENSLLQAKLGGCYQNSAFDGVTYQQRWSVYGTVDYTNDMISSLPGWIDGFAQVGLSNPSTVEVRGYYGLGLSWRNPLGNRLDGAAIGLAYGAATPSTANADREQVVEVTAQVPLFKFISVQADYQYVKDPCFGLLAYGGAHVVMLRLQLDLSYSR